MLKNLKLGAKIGGGFALLIVLTIVVGLISVFNMLRVSANVEKLSDEYVPEVEIACRVERDAQNAVSEFRGYVFSEEDDYLVKGIENLDNLDKGIKLAKDLANQSIHLEKLKAEIEDIESLTIQYRRLSDETAKLTDMIGNEKITLNESAAVYMQNCQEFLDSQYLAMKNEINQGVTDSKLKERSRKIELSTEIYKIGFEARVDIWKALAHRNTEDFDDGIVKLNQADEIIKSLRKITHKTNNQNQLDNIKTARQNYEKALLNIHDHWEEREDLQKQSEAISKDLLLKTQHTAKAGIDQTTIIATEGSNLLSASTKILTIGLLVAIVAGVIIAIFITTSITKPIKVIATVSDAIAVGDLTKTVRFDRNDEIGQMARSFNRMSDSIRGKAEVAEAISQGKLSIDVEVASEEDVLGKALVNVRDNLNSIVSQMETLAKSAIDGHLHHRADANSFKGDYQQLVKGINKVIDTLVGHMDVVPAPLMLIDKEFNINYMNKYGADLCGQSTKEIVGSKCFDHFKTGHCNTKECACAQAMNTKTMIDAETSANPCGNRKEIRYSGVPTYDIDGNVNGALEIVSDQTDIVLAQRKALKISDYQAGEIEKLSRTLQSMSDGDLTVSYKMAEADDDTREVYNSFLGLSQALEETLQGLNEILGQVNVAVEQVNSGSSQVSSASQSLSQGATEQAASLEEVSSSMTEVGAQVQQNADNAEQANTLSATAGKAAEQGNRQMQDMLSAMEDINDSSSQIQKIIKVIDEIAFQTNLLALNAAVEAARAGVHGKGFAVVAEEVRNLAQRSAKAANETTELIEGSVANTENGSQIAQQTAIALEEIEQQVSKVSDLISEINAGSREQNTAIKEIAESLSQIDQVTQANTANAEESAAAAEELAGQSTQLKEMISRFKLVENGYSGITRKSMKRISSGNITGQYGNSASSEKAGAHPKMIEQVEPTEVISLDDTDFGDF